MIIRTRYAPMLWCLMLWWAGCASYRPQNGDLLFQDADCGEFCEAIEKVTRGYKGARLSHVGMVQWYAGRPWVLEARGAGVCRTPLDSFLCRSTTPSGQPKVLVGRLRKTARQYLPIALQYMQAQLGRPYDPVFVLQDSAFYCSELIYRGLQQAGAPERVFALAPMTFRDPATGDIFAAWEAHYRALGVPVPEGLPGLNPGGMSLSRYVRMVHCYYRPTAR